MRKHLVFFGRVSGIIVALSIVYYLFLYKGNNFFSDVWNSHAPLAVFVIASILFVIHLQMISNHEDKVLTKKQAKRIKIYDSPTVKNGLKKNPNLIIEATGFRKNDRANPIPSKGFTISRGERPTNVHADALKN